MAVSVGKGALSSWVSGAVGFEDLGLIAYEAFGTIGTQVYHDDEDYYYWIRLLLDGVSL